MFNLENRRRSKSLDDLIPHGEEACTTTPIVKFKRRHSLCAEPRKLDYIRLANIYGWVYDADTEENKPPIENDPHVFDLVSKDSSHFIHYGKSDTTVTSATVEKLVEKLTREMDNDFLMDFFLTFREFITPIKLCKLLILRFRWALLEENDERSLVRIRTFVVIRHWLTHYWTFDFTVSRTLRFMLCTFLTQLQTHTVILASPRDERIIKNLRTVLKKQRKFYKDWSNPSGSPSRKDSAIAISCFHPEEETWTAKVKNSLKRNVATASCSCKMNNSVQNCIIHTPLISGNRLFFSRHTPYKSILLKYRSEIIAQQFCIIEKTMLQKVTWDELVELRWRKRSSKRQSFIIDLNDTSQGENIGVDQLIGYFNMTCQWVACEVVRSHHMETRVKVIEKLIRIALKCYHHRNYSTLMQILLGLQSPAVTRLEKTWQKIDHCQLELFNQLKEMAKPFRNWKNVRDCMTKATEQVAESFAVESVLTNSVEDLHHTDGGCIPFLGLICRQTCAGLPSPFASLRLQVTGNIKCTLIIHVFIGTLADSRIQLFVRRIKKTTPDFYYCY
ncbi:ras guanine nucleotide exchange factor domain-containing protein [Mucor mucedo]|uniref:ras guanine nucleotide exchange factor domain-containing protein n=1 Tax=Mucor mucedo TaxID=29922 RepID=UPI00221E7459|nr:ras guanine nucleotide exchange factor domain-containing protein [Mucor mucedo]KAI7888719.1 ras guanine nucleotide exchange factor domain-containing protein [Mucor mucedo]